MSTPFKVVATSLAVVGLSAAIATPAFATPRDLPTVATFASQFSTDAHRFEISMNGKPIEITHDGTTTYLAPNGDRRIVGVNADGDTVMTICKAPSTRGLMDCFVNNGGVWAKATLMEPPAKGWLGTVGAHLSDFQSIQVNLLNDAKTQGDSWTATRGRTAGLTRYVLRAISSPTSQTMALTAIFTPRGFKLTKRASDGSAPVVSTVRVVKDQAITFPTDKDATPGWG